MDKKRTVCLTGHRPRFLPWGYDEERQNCKLFKEKLTEMLLEEIENGYSCFLTGMAEGFDMIATELLLKLKEEKDIEVIAIIPCARQEVRWKRDQQLRYRNLLCECDDKIVLSSHYTPGCMLERNMYMVERSALCFACFNGRPSGTEKTLKFALERDCQIRIINPENFRGID